MSDEEQTPDTEQDTDVDQDAATANDPRNQERDSVSTTPGAGCIIVMLGLALFSGIATFAIWTGIQQDRDIAKFAEESPLELPDEPGTPEEVAAVRAKIEKFKSEIAEGQPSTLELTTSEVNFLVHNETALIDIRDMIYFDQITPDAITGRISMPMNRIAFWKPKRYLNGNFTMTLEADRGKLFLRLDGIEVPEKEIPPGFIERIAQDDLLKPYKNDENEDLYASIDSAEMRDGSVIIRSKPVEKKK